MDCSYKTGHKQCTKPSIYTCDSCKNQAFYCEKHGEAHNFHTGHKITSIRNSGLTYFKKEIKACIKSIAKNADAVIAEIRKASLNAIFQLKKANKNIKRIEELTLKPFDSNRISFLVEQARQIDHEMNESPFETSERLSSILKSNEILIQNNQRQIHTLNTEVKTLKGQLEEKDSQLKKMSQTAANKPNTDPAPQSDQHSRNVQSSVPMPSPNKTHQGTS